MFDNNQDRIDAYIRREMTFGDRLDFERDLDTDPALRQEYELTKAISSSLARRQKMLRMMEGWESRISSEQKEATPPVPKIKKWRWWTVGASAAAILAAGFFVLRPSSGPSLSSSGLADATSAGGDALAYAPVTASPPEEDILYQNYGYTAVSGEDVAENAAPCPEVGDCLPPYDYEEDMVVEECNPYPCEIDYVTSDPAVDDEDEDILANAPDEYHITWTRINYLIEHGKKDEALRLLTEYKDKPGKHQEEARKLYKKLTEEQVD